MGIRNLGCFSSLESSMPTVTVSQEPILSSGPKVHLPESPLPQQTPTATITKTRLPQVSQQPAKPEISEQAQDVPQPTLINVKPQENQKKGSNSD